MKRRDFLKATGITLATGSLCLGKEQKLPNDQQVMCDGWTWNPQDQQWEKLDDWRNLNFFRRTIKDPKPHEPHFIANLTGRPVGFKSEAYLQNSWFPFETMDFANGDGYGIHFSTTPTNSFYINSWTTRYRGSDPLLNSWELIGEDIKKMKPFGEVGVFVNESVLETPTCGYCRVGIVAVPYPFGYSPSLEVYISKVLYTGRKQ